jgi:ribosomal subunit interface protein
MRLYLHLTDGGPAPGPEIEDFVRERSERLAHFFDRVQTCRVMLAGRQPGHYEVHVTLTVPMRRELAVSHRHADDLRGAVNAAFEAIERQLAHYASELRRKPAREA